MSEGEEKGLKTFSLEEVAEHTIEKGEDKSIWIVLHDRYGNTGCGAFKRGIQN